MFHDSRLLRRLPRKVYCVCCGRVGLNMSNYDVYMFHVVFLL